MKGIPSSSNQILNQDLVEVCYLWWSCL